MLWLVALHEIKQRLLLLHVHVEHTSTSLETVLKVFIEMHWGLNLGESTKLRGIVFKIQSAHLILVDQGVHSTYRNIYNSNFSLVSTSKPNSTSVCKVYNMHLSLLFTFAVISINLRCLNHNIILVRLVYFEDLEGLVTNFIAIL